MNKREENKFSMYRAVEKVVDEYAETVATIPALTECVNDYKTAIVKIGELDSQYQTIAKGYTVTKDTAEDALVDAMMDVGSALYVYARKTKDEHLKVLCKFSVSQLKKMRDTELLQKAKNLLVSVNAHLEDVAAYGIAAEVVTELERKIKDYDTTLSNKDSKAAESKTARASLTQQFQDVDEILKEDLDTLMELMKQRNREFHNQYKAARVIKDL